MNPLRDSIDRIVDSKFRPFGQRGLMRRTLWTVLTVAILCLAARECDGWQMYGLLWLAAWRAADLILMGVLVDSVDEEIEERRRRFGIVP